VSGSESIYVFGYQGHAYVVIDVALANNLSVLGYYDKKETPTNPYDIPYFGDESLFDEHHFSKQAIYFPAVGLNTIRKKLVRFVENKGLRQIVLKHPTAAISKRVDIGNSSLIAPNAVVNSMVVIGEGCIINSGALIEHECKLGSFSHVAPGAVLAGNVSLGENVFVGANAVVKQGVTIAEDVTIGAGSVVLKNIPKGETWVGNPAKKLMR